MRIREPEYLPDVVEYLFAKVLRRLSYVIFLCNKTLCRILLMFDKEDTED